VSCAAPCVERLQLTSAHDDSCLFGEHFHTRWSDTSPFVARLRENIESMNRFSRFTPERGLLLTMLIVAATYWRDLSYDFLLDDLPLIMMNPTITSWGNWKTIFLTDIFYSPYSPPVLSLHYRPLYMFWLMLNHQLFGMVLPWWHLTSLLLHLLVTVLVYQLSVKFLKKRWLAALAAALFALHPIHTESVAYVAASSDLLVALFSIAALLFYFRFREGGGHASYLIASVCSTAAAMLCKESAGMLPWMLVAYEALRDRQKNELHPSKRYVWTLPHFAVVAGYLALRTRMFGLNTGPGPGGNRLAALADIPLVVLIYLRNLLFPTRLSFYYPAEWSARWTAWRGFAVVLVLWAVVFIWKRHKEHSGTRILLSWTAILLVPPALAVSTFVRDEWVHDRHMYMASIPLCILITSLLADLRLPTKLFVVASSGILLLLAADTYYQVPRFKDEASVYASALQVAPRNATLHSYYAQALWKYRLHEQALEEFRKVIELQPDSLSSYEEYASSLWEIGRRDEALPEYQEALLRAPAGSSRYGFLLYRIGSVESELSKLDAAAGHLRKAIEIAPTALNYHSALSEVLRKQGQTREADEELRIEATNRRQFLERHRRTAP
jgi:protein O-mannosyl-transferase